MKVLQLNTRGMGKTKTALINTLIIRGKPDLVLLQETQLTNEKKTPKFPGFHPVRWDREGKKGEVC